MLAVHVSSMTSNEMKGNTEWPKKKDKLVTCAKFDGSWKRVEKRQTSGIENILHPLTVNIPSAFFQV